MEQGTQVDAVYTDLKAAFDRVDHKILLARLNKLGISSRLTTWLNSYLKDRQMCVKIGPAQSATFSNPSGVPQGSNLGPLLFSLYINEVSLILPTGCRLFYADDVKIYMAIRNALDCHRLQDLVNRFEEWCLRNMMSLSISKCSTISFHRKLKPIVFNYSISGQVLSRVSHIRDLGVTLDNALSFRLHFNEIIAKANRQLGFVLKITSEFRDPHCLRSLYCSLVRSTLEFSAVVWCPFQTNWICRIESIQRKFVRHALRNLPWRDPLNLPPYEARCQLLGLETLERRRFNAQAMFVAKLLTGEIDCPALLEQINMYAPERILRTRNFLYLEGRSVNYALHNPVRFMSVRFNDVFDLFDFNISSDTFYRRLTRR